MHKKSRSPWMRRTAYEAKKGEGTYWSHFSC